MSLNGLNSNDAVKIKDLLDAGERVLEEVEMLKEGLKDTVKGIAEELDIKPSTINKAIRLAYKSRTEDAIGDAQTEMSDVEQLLHAAGRI